jgi:hypothetical protein
VLLCLAIPGTGFASTQKAPYSFGEAFSFCDAKGGAKCTRSESAIAKTGALTLDEQVSTTLPARGLVMGVAVVGGGFYLQKAAKSVPVSVTLRIDSATASTPTPLSTLVTGSFATVIAGGGGFVQGCNTCGGYAAKVVVSQGTPPALPAIPPAIPGMPPIPPPAPSAPGAPNLPGQAGPTTITVKFSVTNSKGLVPAGVVEVGVAVEALGVLGGGGFPSTPGIPATPLTQAQKPVPLWQDFLGPQPVMNDVGTTRAAIKATVLSISY